MGLRKVRPLSGDHLEIGALCFLCKLPIQAGDEICRVPQNADGRESGSLVANQNWSDQSLLGVTSVLSPTLVNDLRFSFWYWQNRNIPAPCGTVGAV